MSDVAKGLATALADRYRIERELGQGGMATVYLAEDLKHKRKVAVKVLKPELAAVLGAERFLQEITTTAALQHPHILPLFDSGEADGFLYYVMPFVDGETLRAKLERERQLTIDEAVQITREVADALAYAHSQGIVHRDIKPENILLAGSHALVADFGIARAVGAAGGNQLTATGTAIGTLAYMSPEQSAGLSEVDGRSDTYSLASVLYEMLAGEPPHTGATAAAVIAKRLGTTAPSVRILRETVPTNVDRALQRALQRAPSDRFATAAEFAAGLSVTERRARQLGRGTTIGVVAMLVLAVLAWMKFRGGSDDSALDANVIAVFPFRVGGSNASIGYLRESMLDLMQARLSSGTGARTVEPRTMLAAWRRDGGSEKGDLSEDASRILARKLGAGRVLLGSAIATPTELTLTGTLLRTGDGHVVAQEFIAGAPDSIAVLVNRLTAALLIREAGESRERQSGLASAPLDALQDYLAGRAAYRRGDYFGAMHLFEKAFARDSTFVDAAFSMVATNAWIGTVVTTAGYEVIPRVSLMRGRLGVRDRELFLSLPWVGPNYPNVSTYRETIAQAERAANAAPDSPESWLLLGQLLAHYGAAASEPDRFTRAEAAYGRAIALDSTFAKVIEERTFLAMQSGDSAATARYAALFERQVASGFNDDMVLWAARRSLGDSAAAIHWRERREGLTHVDYVQKLIRISLHSAAFVLPLDDARWAASALVPEAATPNERGGAQLSDLAVRFAEGRRDVGDLRATEPFGAGWAATMIQQALIEPAYRDMAASVIAREESGGYRLDHGVRVPSLRDCYVTLFHVAAGDTSGAGAAARRLQSSSLDPEAPAGGPEAKNTSRICALVIGALLERTSRTGNAGNAGNAGNTWPALDRLDSTMKDGPHWFGGWTSMPPVAYGNFVVARLRAADGHYPAALAAIRRREVDYFPQYLWSLPAYLRIEGRMAALVGDTTSAVRAYDQYLTLRTAPDAAFRPQRDSVVAERRALVAKVKR